VLSRKSALIPAAAFLGLTIWLLVYSQTIAFTWDEGFHLLAAQLILAGKRPYLDFCFPQSPLNAWWNAGWMRVFGQSWRVAQALAALATAGAAWLAGDFVYRRLGVPGWRAAAAVTAGLLLGLNELAVRYGTVAQAYGICLLLMVAAFRAAILTPERRGWRWAAAAGLSVGAAAGCSMLSAVGGPALLVWIPWYSRQGNRWAKAAAFVAGAAIPFAPVAWLFAKGPHQTWFNLIQYQALYRRYDWGGTASHDLVELSGWLDSSQAVLLCLLAAAGLWYLRGGEWSPEQRNEFRLCGWLAVTMGMAIAFARPTFMRYFVMVTPFLAMPAAAGFAEAMVRLRGGPERAWLPTLALAVLTGMGLARAIYDNSDVYRWRDLEKVAAKVRQVTPPGSRLYGEEEFYFLLHRDPPEGIEFVYARALKLPAAEAAQLHITPQTEFDRQVKAGEFDTVVACEDPDALKRMDLKTRFRQTAQVQYCDIFWDKAPEAPAAPR